MKRCAFPSTSLHFPFFCTENVPQKMEEYTPETPFVWSTFCALTFLPLQRPSKSHTLLVK